MTVLTFVILLPPFDTTGGESAPARRLERAEYIRFEAVTSWKESLAVKFEPLIAYDRYFYPVHPTY